MNSYRICQYDYLRLERPLFIAHAHTLRTNDDVPNTTKHP
ncbi:hypothetical protein dsmv_0148 [Desulfococcus multivorans DSM 2059]|uniref:Uncharacterized protein n=1 Tax=Desulfococcus multivorans DSM 2059 TaxID=1121405 RepID=S7V796_DESML|nr:hypothetical protein dsmv_0148 [Desulfococcus multivorans DSM 2059]